MDEKRTQACPVGQGRRIRDESGEAAQSYAAYGEQWKGAENVAQAQPLILTGGSMDPRRDQPILTASVNGILAEYAVRLRIATTTDFDNTVSGR